MNVPEMGIGYLEKFEIPGCEDFGALRVRTVASKDRQCGTFPDKDNDGKPLSSVVLDFDYTVLMIRR